jgi:hypothetical protein
LYGVEAGKFSRKIKWSHYTVQTCAVQSFDGKNVLPHNYQWVLFCRTTLLLTDSDQTTHLYVVFNQPERPNNLAVHCTESFINRPQWTRLASSIKFLLRRWNSFLFISHWGSLHEKKKNYQRQNSILVGSIWAYFRPLLHLSGEYRTFIVSV